MTERASTHHSPRVDDALAAETASMTRGAPVEARAEEWKQKEPPADGEPVPDARIAGGLDEIEARSQLAAALRPSVFPARRSALLHVAQEEHADTDVIELLRTLPGDHTYTTVQDVWLALGGHTEQRAPERATVPEPEEREPELDGHAEPPGLLHRVVDVGVGAVVTAVGVGVTLARRLRRR